MEINPKNLLSIKEVLADVLVIMDDENNSKLTPGFYRAQVKYALDELGFDISLIPVIDDYPMPVDLLIEMPKGCFNLKKINVYTGTPEAVGYVENVYWAKGVTTRGKETGIVSDITGFNVTDPFCRAEVTIGTAFYFSIQNGIIRLSDACSVYDYVRLIFDGIPSKTLDEVRMVPPETRKAIVLWTVDKCAGALKMRDNRYRQVQADAANQLDEYGFNGAWHEAKMRLLRLDKKKLNDVILYNSSLLTL